MAWEIHFYEGFDQEVLKLPAKIQAKMIRLFELIENHGANLGEPHTKSLGGGLFEIRAKAQEGIARGMFCYLEGEKVIILHVFVKKTQKIPNKELAIARKRMLEVKS